MFDRWKKIGSRVETGRCDETSSTRLGSARLGSAPVRTRRASNRVPRACHREPGRVLFRLKRVLEDALGGVTEVARPRRKERKRTPRGQSKARRRDACVFETLVLAKSAFRIVSTRGSLFTSLLSLVQLREKGARYPSGQFVANYYVPFALLCLLRERFARTFYSNGGGSFL